MSLPNEPLIFLLALAFRLVNSLLLQTQFDPDEFWQALEPAHLLVYGRGHLTWEWAPGVELRSWTHPLLLSGPLAVAKLLFPESAQAAILLPRLLFHAPLAALADVSTYHLALRMYGPLTARWALTLSLTSWFNFYALPRSYSNSLETCLFALAAAIMPLPGTAPSPHLVKALALAAVAVACRPPALIAWMVLGPLHLVDQGSLQPLWAAALPVGAVALVLLVSLDSFLYSHLVLTPWNFVKINFLQSDISSLYGTHPWHWYLSQCLPAILGSALPFCLHALLLQPWHPALTRLLLAVLAQLALLSLSPHKELRFALPVLPVLHILAAISLSRLWPTFQPKLGLILAVLNAIPALYLGLVHQRAPIDCAAYLAASEHVRSVDMLLPCHAMPLFSHVHKDVPLVFLDCSPPQLVLPERFDRAWTAFADNPSNFVASRYPPYPSHIVTNSQFEAKVLAGLGGRFGVEKRFAHGQDGEEIVLLSQQA